MLWVLSIYLSPDLVKSRYLKILHNIWGICHMNE